MINALKIAFLVSNEDYSIYFPRDLYIIYLFAFEKSRREETWIKKKPVK